MQPAKAASAAQAPAHVKDKVSEWLNLDADAASRAKVEALLDKGAHRELEELMCQRLEFGGFLYAGRICKQRTVTSCTAYVCHVLHRCHIEGCAGMYG